MLQKVHNGDFSVGLTQSADKLLQLCGTGARLHAFRRVIGIGAGGIARLRHGIVTRGLHLAYPCAFQVVLAFVGRHPHEPLLIVLRLAPVYGRERREKGVLSHILSGVGVVNKLQADCVDQSLILLHQPGKFFICQRPHLLCFVLLYTKTNSPAPILQARGKNFNK